MREKKSTVTSLPARSYSELTIGASLVKMGKISVDDADTVMRSLTNSNMRFGEAAKSLGLVTEADIQEVLSKQFDYPYIINGNEFDPDLFTAYEPNSVQAEFIKSLRAQLLLSWFKDTQKTLAISSINQGSGNSTLCANLAVSFAQVGKKTLLIDANLRSPRQNKLFKINTQRGLSDILINRASLETLFRVESLEKLTILHAGTLPPNPQEIVSGKVFKELIEFFNETFDVIIVDTPAFSVGADALAIGATVNGTLLVAKKHSTRAARMQSIVSMLVRNGGRIAGSVLTDFD